VLKEKVHEDGTKAAKTPLMIYYAKFHDNILWIHPWLDELQRSVNDFWSRIICYLRGDCYRPFMNGVLAGFIGNRSGTCSLPHSENVHQQSVNELWFEGQVI